MPNARKEFFADCGALNEFATTHTPNESVGELYANESIFDDALMLNEVVFPDGDYARRIGFRVTRRKGHHDHLPTRSAYSGHQHEEMFSFGIVGRAGRTEQRCSWGSLEHQG